MKSSRSLARIATSKLGRAASRAARPRAIAVPPLRRPPPPVRCAPQCASGGALAMSRGAAGWEAPAAAASRGQGPRAGLARARGGLLCGHVHVFVGEHLREVLLRLVL